MIDQGDDAAVEFGCSSWGAVATAVCEIDETARDIQQIVCPQCSALLEVADDRCHHCGARTAIPAVEASPEAPSAETVPELQPVWPRAGQEIADRRGLVLLLLFGVLGPLALPVLRKSSKFSRPWKIVLTILVLAETLLILWLLWHLVDVMIVEPLAEYGVLGTS